MSLRKLTLSVFTLVLYSGLAFAQIINLKKIQTNETLKRYVVAFYNVENLFDTYNDPRTNDDDFTPSGKLNWTQERYQRKIQNLAMSIARIEAYAPDLLGLCEVENRQVLEDLIDTDYLRMKDYGIIHYDSPDERGIDVALLYKRHAFQPYKSQAYPVKLEKDKTRDILMVSGILGGRDTLHVIVCHFPSRRGGAKESEPKRMMAAQRVRALINTLYEQQPQANIIVMGDFNDEPNNKSLWEGLQARPHSFDLKPGELYNPMAVLHYQQQGSYRYQEHWQMLDQILLSQSLLKTDGRLRYRMGSASIFAPDFLRQTKGDHAGSPLPTYAGEQYLGGFSDHFPVYIVLEQQL